MHKSIKIHRFCGMYATRHRAYTFLIGNYLRTLYWSLSKMLSWKIIICMEKHVVLCISLAWPCIGKLILFAKIIWYLLTSSSFLWCITLHNFADYGFSHEHGSHCWKSKMRLSMNGRIEWRNRSLIKIRETTRQKIYNRKNFSLRFSKHICTNNFWHIWNAFKGTNYFVWSITITTLYVSVFCMLYVRNSTELQLECFYAMPFPSKRISLYPNISKHPKIWKCALFTKESDQVSQ